MKKKIEKGTEEFQMFQDFWNFRQEFYEPEENEEFWEKVKINADVFYQKYKNMEFSDFAKSLLFACLDDLDRKARDKK